MGDQVKRRDWIIFGLGLFCAAVVLFAVRFFERREVLSIEDRLDVLHDRAVENRRMIEENRDMTWRVDLQTGLIRRETGR